MDFSNQQFWPRDLDLEVIDSLNSNASRRLFLRLPSFRPTLEEALEDAGIHNKSVLKDSKEFSGYALEDPEISTLGLTEDEAGAISCYTLEKEKSRHTELLMKVLLDQETEQVYHPHENLFFFFFLGFESFLVTDLLLGKCFIVA